MLLLSMLACMPSSLISTTPEAEAYSKAWADTNNLVYNQGTGAKTRHVATLEEDGSDGVLTWACLKENGVEVDWTEFFITASHIPVERLEVDINTLTGGPAPRQAVCSLYEDSLLIEDWTVTVNAQ